MFKLSVTRERVIRPIGGWEVEPENNDTLQVFKHEETPIDPILKYDPRAL